MNTNIETGYIKIIFSMGRIFQPDRFTCEVGARAGIMQLIKI